MERHVSSYSIHLNVCTLKTQPTMVTDPPLPFSCRKLQMIFHISSLKIGDCKSKPKISVRSWPRSKTCWYAFPATTSSLAELTIGTDQETVDVDRESLATLTKGSLEKSKSIQKLEEAAADLYKALQAGRDRGLQKFRCGLAWDGDFPDKFISRHGRRNGTTLRIQDVQFSVLQANLRLLVYHVYCSGTLANSLHQGSELISFLHDFRQRCFLVTTMV